MPAVAADTNGVVHMSWFDTRTSPTNPDLLDIFATFTLNNGGSFAPNARANATQITASSGDFIGNYSGIAAGPNGTTGLAQQKIFGTLTGHSDQGKPWVSPKVDRS